MPKTLYEVPSVLAVVQLSVAVRADRYGVGYCIFASVCEPDNMVDLEIGQPLAIDERGLCFAAFADALGVL